MASFTGHRWNADENSFAIRVHVDNVPGFFSGQLIVEPGTRAWIVDEGLLAGEVPAGAYTLETFSQRLKFWKQRQCTAIITRQEDVRLTVVCDNIPTAESLLVRVHVRLTVQMADVALFLSNLMGARSAFTIGDLRQAISPFLADSIRSVLSQQPITELLQPAVTQALDAAMDQHVSLALRRYGLRFSQVQTIGIAHSRYNEYQQKEGEIWLMNLEHGQTQKLDALYHEQELQRVLNQQRASQVEVMLQSVEADHRDSERDLLIRRVRVRQEMRKAVQTDEFDKLTTAEEKLRYLEARDRDRLIRADELIQLREILQQRSEDRELVRAQVLRKLDLEQEFEIQQLQQDLRYQVEVRRRNHEIDLTRMSDTEDTRRWRDSLALQAEEAQKNREERWKAWDDRKARFRDYWAAKRDDQLTGLLHEIEKDRLSGNAEIENTERRNRIRLIEQELREQLHSSELTLRRQRDDYSHSLTVRDSEFRRQQDQLAAEDKLELERRWTELRQRAAHGELDLTVARQMHEQEMLNRMQSRSMELDRHQMEMLRIKRTLDEDSRDAQHRRESDARRLEMEFAQLKEDRLAQFRLTRMDKFNERIRSLSGMGVDGLIAFADSRNASILAEKEKERFRQDAEIRRTDAAIAQANASAAAAVTDRERSVMERMLQSKDEVSAAKDQALQSVAAAYEKALQMVHQNSQQSLTTVSDVTAVHARNMSQPTVIVPPVVAAGNASASASAAAGTGPVPAPAAPAPAAPAVKPVVLCSNCRATISVDKKFCDNCGQRI